MNKYTAITEWNTCYNRPTADSSDFLVSRHSPATNDQSHLSRPKRFSGNSQWLPRLLLAWHTESLKFCCIVGNLRASFGLKKKKSLQQSLFWHQNANKIINHKTACVDSLNVKNNFSCPPPTQYQHRWIKKELKMKEFWQLSAKLCCKLTAIPARVSEVSVAFTPLLFLLIQMIYWPGGSVGENIMLNNAVRRLLTLPSVHEHLEWMWTKMMLAIQYKK